MRLATLEHLIAAEDAADRARGRAGPEIEVADFDVDGFDELLVTAPGQRALLKPSAGGAIASWDARATRHALGSVLRRREEAYHETLRQADSGQVDQREAGEGAVSIHDLVKVNEPGMSGRLWYDDYERRSALVHVMPTDTTAESFEQASFEELGDFVTGSFEVLETAGDRIVLERDGTIRHGDGTRGPLRVRKEHVFGTDRRVPTLVSRIGITNTGTRAVEARLCLEWNLNLLGGGGNPSAWYKVNGQTGRFDRREIAERTDHVGMGNDYIGIELEARPTPPSAAWWWSVETMSLSESGFEANHQGGSLSFVWPLSLGPGESTTVTLDMLVRSSRDRAEEEGL
jgi:hypothetical protein